MLKVGVRNMREQDSRWKPCLLSVALVCLLMPSLGIGSSLPSHQSYRLGSNDVVRIQVYGEEDLTVESKVDGDGHINFPLLGMVSVAGKTTQELQEYLATRLASGYVRAPKVTAYVFKHRNVYVSGEVRAPGGYPYEEGLSVQKAVTIAGGLTDKAERNELRILRIVNGKEQTVQVQPDGLVLPDDTIVVAEGQRFYVSGEVKTPGRYLYEKAMTVHKALSMAGGRTEKGDKGLIKVTRLANGVAETLAATSDGAVLPDDILVVEPQDYKFYASGEVKNPGGYPYKEGLTVHKAIAMAGGLTEKAERGELHILRSAQGQEETLVTKPDSLVLPDDTIVVAEGQRFYVSGEVKTPGRYLYEKGLTVHKALSMAGGRTEKGEKGLIKVTRLANGMAETLAATADAAVLPDDILVVEPQDYKFYASGEVKNPGGYPYKEGLTVHKAIAMAGGLTEKAERGELHILRSAQGREETLVAKLDSLVLPDDTIVVAEGQRFYVSGEVKTPGRYLYEKGMTVHKALTLAGGRLEKAEKGTIKVTRLANGVAETLVANPEAAVLPDDIIVAELQDHKFYTSGEVKNPGGYPYKEGLTVHKAIAMAGGVTEKADRDTLRVLRHTDAGEETLAVKLDALVLPDDIIVVAEGQRVYVSGEVKTPGRFLYENGMTVHKAITMAGGFTEKADKATIQVTRVTDGLAHTKEATLDTAMLPNDFVVISQIHKVYVNGEVRKAGDYAYEKGLTIHKVITMAGGFTDKAAIGRTKVLRIVDGQEQSLKVNLDAIVLPEDIVVVPRSFF
jgi:polysaccharide biosynthesis/export protein